MRPIEKQQGGEPTAGDRKPAIRKRPMVVVAELTTYAETVPQALDGLDAGGILAGQQCIVIKPNLIEAKKPPVTTDVKCVEAVVAYCKRFSDARIVVADGSGGCETAECFSKLGYGRLEAQYGVQLMDLNGAKTVTLTNESHVFLKEFNMPEILLESYLISVPVLKAHSMAGVTLGMKNMIGVAPDRFYRRGGHYKKWSLHDNLDRAIIEINKFRKPDLTLIDAAVGMATAHLWGPRCDPPVGKLVASFDPVAADKVGCDLLNKDWWVVRHVVLADGVLGRADGEVRLLEE